MKVADVFKKDVEFVGPDMPLLGVAKLIFGRGINGLPVCKSRKVVGFITERDILSKFYPSVQEYVEDPFRSSDFEGMEKKVSEILDLKAERIMSKNPVVVTSDMPLLRAQSLMFIHKVGRLPVVDGNGKLLGILSKGDIFRYLVGEKLPFEEDEQFHDWLSKRYDLIINQKARLSREIPDLVEVLRKLNAKTVLDVGCGTGEHSIALAQEGFEVAGIDRSSKMIDVAEEKIKSLPSQTQQRVKFISKDYKSLDTLLGKKFDAAIFMGSTLAHVENPQQLLQEVSRVLNNRAIIICQVVNYDKVIKVNKRLYDFNIRKSSYPEEEQAFLRFCDEKEKGFLTQNLSVFVRSSKRWTFRGMQSMRVYPLTKAKVTAFLKKVKFSNIKSYGGEKGFFYDSLFRRPFKGIKSDVFTIVAKR